MRIETFNSKESYINRFYEISERPCIKTKIYITIDELKNFKFPEYALLIRNEETEYLFDLNFSRREVNAALWDGEKFQDFTSHTRDFEETIAKIYVVKQVENFSKKKSKKCLTSTNKQCYNSTRNKNKS